MISSLATASTITQYCRGGASTRKFKIFLWGRGTFALIGLLTGCSNPPNDMQMDELFRRNRQSFDELREMLGADSSMRVVRNDWVATLDGTEEHSRDQAKVIARTRWDEYRTKFRQLGLQGGATRATQGPCEFYFDKYGSGFAFSSVSKGYASCASEPTPLVHDLDHDEIQPKTITYRALLDKWYLFYEID
jgi:hypothetical protein